MDLELVGALAAGIKEILTAAGTESGKQIVERLFERLRRSPEAQQPDVELALDNIAGGNSSDEEFRLVETVLAAVMKRDQTLADLASQILTHVGTTTTTTSSTTGVGDGATIHGNVIITTTSEAGGRTERPVFDLTLFSDGPLPRASPTSPAGLVLGLVNQSAQRQVAVIDGYGRGMEAIEFATRRMTLGPYETTEVDLEVRPDLSVAPRDYQVHLRVRSETVPDRPPVTTGLRFTVLPHQEITTGVSVGAGHAGAVTATLRNAGNTSLDLLLKAACNGAPLPEADARLRLPVGAEQTMPLEGLSRPLLGSRRIRLRLFLSSADGYRSEQDHVLTLLPAITWRPGRSLSAQQRVVWGIGALAVVLIGLFALLHDDEPAAGPTAAPASPRNSAPVAISRPAVAQARDTPCPGMPQTGRVPVRVDPSPGPVAGLQSVTMGGNVSGGVNLVIEEHLALVSSDDGRVHAVDTGTMTERWFSACLDAPGTSQPTRAGDRVYAVSAAGSLRTFALNATGQQDPVLNPIAVGGRVTLKPYLSADAVVVTVQKGDTTWVQTYSTTDGSSLGSRQYPGVMRQNPASSQGERLYVASGSARIAVLSAPKNDRPLGQERDETLPGGPAGARLHYVTIPPDQAGGGQRKNREIVVAAGAASQDAEQPGVLVVWPKAGLTASPMIVPLPGVPTARATDWPMSRCRPRPAQNWSWSNWLPAS
jgi:hypothetical protein